MVGPLLGGAKNATMKHRFSAICAESCLLLEGELAASEAVQPLLMQVACERGDEDFEHLELGDGHLPEMVLHHCRTMREGIAEPAVQCRGAARLAKLMHGGLTGVGVRFAESAAVEAIVCALTFHPTDWDVQLACCAALGRIMEEASRRQMLLHTSACEALIGAIIRATAEAPRVSACACAGLANFAADPQAIRRAVHAGAAREIVAMMRFAPTDGEIQENGCIALSRFAVDASAVKIAKELVQEGSPEVLMSAIRNFPRRVILLRHATAALHNLVKSRALNTDFIDLHLGEKLLLAATQDDAKPRASR
ncbi:hypothetical protein AB1Y20_004760 [Prymnesium parvum]|uniref:LRRK2 ARM repeat domain-containing protein n=1 Tax=Prymnesium parvum TaxID=97485 RepID=A0AB34IYG1_PRYPA